MNFQTLTPLILLATTLYTFQSLVRYAKAMDWNGVLAIVLSCVAGIAAIALAAHSAATGDLVLVQGGAPLGLLDGGAQVMLGIAVGTTAPVIADTFKTFDNTRTSSKPRLLSKSTRAEGSA